MNTPPMVQLHLFFATENDSALILRRAKDRLYNLIAWDRKADRFVEGQWIKKYVRPELCSLSPDGRHFLYFIANADMCRAASEHYTAISRPPWFTALALFPQGGLWVAGGGFLSNDQYFIEGDLKTDDIIGQAGALTQIVRGDVTHTCRTGLRLRNGRPAPLSKRLRERLLAGDTAPNSDAGGLYETQAGRLYRKRGMELELIRDFTEMEPRFEPAPYDTRPAKERADGWHPADQEGG